jgi:hypothetical protein
MDRYYLSGFRAGFSEAFGVPAAIVLPTKERTPTSGGKLVGVLGCGGGGYATRPRFFKYEVELAKNRLLKMLQEAFSVGVRYHDPSGILPRSQVQE